VGWDSQASFGVTNDIRLFGGKPLRDDITFQITDWASEVKLVSQYGMTAFGFMIYTPESSGTIICEHAAYQLWEVVVDYNDTKNIVSRTLTHKIQRDLVLKLESNDKNALSGSVLEEELFARVCMLANADVSKLSKILEGNGPSA